MFVRHRILDAKPLDDPSRAVDKITRVLVDIINGYELKDKIHLIVRDGAMGAAATGLDSNRIGAWATFQTE